MSKINKKAVGGRQNKLDRIRISFLVTTEACSIRKGGADVSFRST